MMLGEAFIRNEWRILGRHPLVWLALGGATLFSALVVRGSPADPAEGAAVALRWFNLFLPMFILPFVAGALAAIFYLREHDHDMAEIVGSYPVSPKQWLTMRVGSFFLLMLVVCLLAETAGIVMLAPDFPGEFGQMALQGMGWLLLFHAPTCLIWASALAWIASRKANSGLLYFAAGIGWLGYIALATLTGIPMIAGSFVPWEPLKHAMLVLDPYAATALLNPMPQSGPLQWREANIAMGRIFWLVVCWLILRSIQSLPTHAMRKTEKVKPTRSAAAVGGSGPIWLGLRFVLHDKVFPLLVLGWFALLLPEVLGGMDYVEPLSRVSPDSRDALNRVVWDIVIGAGSILLLYVADRICRLYPTSRMQELYAATPHRPQALLFGQLIGLWLVATFFVALAALAVLASQLIAGSPIAAQEYVTQLGLALTRLLLAGGLFVALHGLVRQRYLANLVGLLLTIFGLSSLLPSIGLHHPLWRPLRTPLTAPDHVWGYGGSLFGHGQFMLFWGAIVLAALLLAVACHHRTLRHPQIRWRTALRTAPSLAALSLLIGASVQGTMIDQVLRQEGALVTREDRNQWRADYERNYGSWADVAQPEVTAIRSRVDFHPHQQRVRLKSEISLTNRSETPIATLLVGRNIRDHGLGRIQLDHASIQRHDTSLGQTIFELDRPLQSGETIKLDFAIEVAQSGLTAAEFPLVLRPDFNAFPVFELLPVVGFEPQYRLREEANRLEWGLPPLDLTPPSKLTAADAAKARGNMVILDSIVSTDADQYGVSQGELLRSWTKAGRNHAHYRTRQPIRNMPAFFSTPWKPFYWKSGDHELHLYAPGPIDAEDPNLLGMNDALNWLNRDIAPYPGKRLSLIATPELGFTGFALPQIIELSNRVSFRAEPTADAGFNQNYRRAAHETAHQWFGHLLGHGIPEEHAFMVESLAKYAELVLIERRYGKAAMQALVDYEYDRYRQQRIDPAQLVLPLIDADDTVDMYSRATLAFACIRGEIGDEPIIATLHNLAAQSQRAGRPARSIEFVNQLMVASPPQARGMIKRLLLGNDPVEASLLVAGCRTNQK